MTGTIDDPMTLSAALASSQIAPGDTVVLRGGTYTGDFVCSNLRGLPGRPITVRPHLDEPVKIDGSLTINGQYTDWHRLEIMYSGWTTRQSAEVGEAPTDLPIDKVLGVYGRGTRIFDSIIHDLAIVGHWATVVGGVMYGNVIYNIGWLDSTGAGFGHAMYAQNSLALAEEQYKEIHQNIMLNCFNFGLHIFSESTQMYYFDVRENIAFGNSARDLLFCGPGQRLKYAEIVGNCDWPGNTSYMKASFVKLRDNFIPGFTWFETSIIDEDINNYWGPMPTTGLKVLIFVNEHNTSRGHLAIYNWDGLDTVPVDVTQILRPGDAYQLRNAQDYFVDIQTGTVAADGTIQVDMQAANRTVAAPIGWTAQPTTFPTFGAFVLERTG